MSIKQKNLTEATADERLAYAINFLNLPITPGDNDENVTTKIRQAQPGVDRIFVNEADTPDEVAATEQVEVEFRAEETPGKQAGSLGKGDPRAIIFIPVIDTEDESGARDVVVGVNGRAWQLKRGVDLPVPYRVVEALENASATIVRHSQEEGKEGEVITRQAKRFAFEFIERPSKEAIAEWHKRTDAQFCA